MATNNDEVEQRKAAQITKKDIPEIARQAGLQVVSEKNGAFVDIYRKGRKTPTIRIWQDGSINRADVELHLCKDMHIGETLEALGLKVSCQPR